MSQAPKQVSAAGSARTGRFRGAAWLLLVLLLSDQAAVAALGADVGPLGAVEHPAAPLPSVQPVDRLVELAWVLAAHPDPRVRDAALAQQSAAKAVALTDARHAPALRALAAAEAEAGRFAAALDRVAQAQRLDPRESAGPAHFAGAAELLRQGLPLRDRRLPDFPPGEPTTDPSPNARLARAHLVAGMACQRQGDLAAAESHFQRAALLDRRLQAPHLRQAQLAHRRGEPALVQRHLEAALQNQPDDPEVLIALGSALEQQGQTAAALDRYRQALRLRPDSPQVLNDLAWLLATAHPAALRQPDEAVALARRLCRLAAEEPAYWDTLAVALAAAGRFEEAQHVLRQALRQLGTSDPARAARYRQRLERFAAGRPYRGVLDDGLDEARRAVARRQPHMALATLSQLKARWPDEPDVLLYEALAFEQLGANERAVAAYARLLELLPGGRQSEPAAQTAVAAVSAHLEYWDVVNEAAWLLATRRDPRPGDRQLAVGLAERMCAVRPAPAYLDTLGVAYAAAGRFVDAQQAARRALAALEQEGSGNQAAAAENRRRAYAQRLRLYAASRPYEDLEQEPLTADRPSEPPADAVRRLEMRLEQAPEDARAWALLGSLRETLHQTDQAVAAYRRAVALRPDWDRLVNDLAWLLAAHPGAPYHDPAEAVRLAEGLCRRWRFSQPAYLDTLGVAYAACGRFDEAVRAAQQAMDRLKSDQADPSRHAQYEARQALYSQQRPYVETPRCTGAARQ